MIEYTCPNCNNKLRKRICNHKNKSTNKDKYINKYLCGACNELFTDTAKLKIFEQKRIYTIGDKSNQTRRSNEADLMKLSEYLGGKIHLKHSLPQENINESR